MATPNPKKAVLQSAAADTYSKAGAEMKQAELLLAKPDVSASKPSKAGRANAKRSEIPLRTKTPYLRPFPEHQRITP